MERRVFYVADEPYCVWGSDPAATSRQFLAGIDPDYYWYLAALHGAQLQAGGHKQRTAIALRTAAYHGIETLLALA